jgi:hypothetical protein
LLFKQLLELNSKRAKSEDLPVQAGSVYMEVQNDVEVLNFELKWILDCIQHLAIEEDHIEEQLE